MRRDTDDNEIPSNHDPEGVERRKRRRLKLREGDMSLLVRTFYDFYGTLMGGISYNQSQKYWDTSTKKRPFLLQITPAVFIGLWDIILTSLLPPIRSCSSKFWVWSCIASNFDKGWRGDHKHKIMDRPFTPNKYKYLYGTVASSGQVIGGRGI